MHQTLTLNLRTKCQSNIEAYTSKKNCKQWKEVTRVILQQLTLGVFQFTISREKEANKNQDTQMVNFSNLLRPKQRVFEELAHVREPQISMPPDVQYWLPSALPLLFPKPQEKPWILTILHSLMGTQLRSILPLCSPLNHHPLMHLKMVQLSFKQMEPTLNPLRRSRRHNFRRPTVQFEQDESERSANGTYLLMLRSRSKIL